MEDNNILTGGMDELKRYRDLVSLSNTTKTEQAATDTKKKQIEKELATAKKNLKDAKESTVKKRRAEVENQFKSQISKESGKLKKAQNERGKAKAAGVKGRITDETADLTAQNKELKATIKTMLKENKLPGFAGRDYFFTLYFTKGFGEVMTCILTVIVAFLLLPGGITCLLWHFAFHDEHLVIIAILCYFIIIVLGFLLYILIGNKTKHRCHDQLKEIRTLRDTIHHNKKQIKAISSSIERDTNEEMYGLGDYDSRIADVEGSIDTIESAKTEALKQFDEVTAPQLIQELEDRDTPHIQELEQSLTAAEGRLSDLDKVRKETDIQITTEYEAYIGKQFSNLEAIDALISIMAAGGAATIGDAVNAYKNQKKNQ